ncbi:MAG: Lrp/AsnC family transcriptional regulator [Chitinophagaceae bacterium]|jgi:DNA-binding Lrp family transcriptional regulator|nr:Lrp/AsnC family transcriptional regulator [Chitinophagaceae bacterium]OQY92685.1 MAG: AsnC family transcriptional regulator [Sphingobacteriales bacterium UTBCD1]
MPKPVKKEEFTTPLKLDQKDLAILRLLQQNARMTVKEISDKVHLSTTPVFERIRWMEETGVIRHYAALVDHAKVNKELMVICYVALKQHSKAAGTKFIRAINEMDEVTECFSISGEFDFILKVITENMNTYYDFHVNRLGEIENIGNVQSVFVMGVVKQTQVKV